MPPDPSPAPRREVCFVTGTRAEFGLMVRTLQAIRARPELSLKIIATGMHLDASRGNSLRQIEAAGFNVDAIVPWPTGTTGGDTAIATGRAMADIASVLAGMRSPIVLVVGDRVEAFAAASAAYVSGLIVAHVHGGDRARGTLDDSLRHAITKLAHLHFPATRASADRIAKLGERPEAIHPVGTPGLDDIEQLALSADATRTKYPTLRPREFALIVLHPESQDAQQEALNAQLLLDAARSLAMPLVIVYPNTDVGSEGIARTWDASAQEPAPADVQFFRDLARPDYLALVRDAAVLLGNSSSGIIEAATFGTPVVDIGTRQEGRERSENVFPARFDRGSILEAASRAMHDARRRQYRYGNVYAGRKGSAADAIASTLATLDLRGLSPKLICY